MVKFKKVKVIGNVIGYNRYAFSKKETYNVQFPDMTIAELKSYQFEDADAYHTDGKTLCLRNVLARLHELPEHDREVWMDEIMHEFANDYGSVKYTLGYEQGKFDGAVEAEKSNKVVIPQFVADIIEYYKKKNAPIVDVFTEKNTDKKYARWLATDFNAYDRVARAWLDGYDVEQERRYVVTDGNHLYFKKCQEDVEIVILVDDMPGTMDDVKKFDSKDEAQEIADVLGWKVQEVE